MSDKPTGAERFLFENNGYFILEGLIAPDHVQRLQAALLAVVARRRAWQERGEPHTGMTQIKGDHSTRIFYILDDDPLFLQLLDWPAIWPYVTELLNPRPHHHASDAIVEFGPELADRPMGWHLDGHDNGYRNVGHPIPLLQLKLGYYLTDMREAGLGNLCVVPGSHKSRLSPDAGDLQRPELFPGAQQICGPAGTAILFHNALWHSSGPMTKGDGGRTMLYYAYEHPWMIASQEHWGYSPTFYNRLSPEQRRLFHGFLFDPPEQRWG